MFTIYCVCYNCLVTFRFSGQFMTFPGILIFLPPKTSLGWGGAIVLSESQSHVNPQICVTDLVAVRRSCRRGGAQTPTQTDKLTLQLFMYRRFDLLLLRDCCFAWDVLCMVLSNTSKE